MVCVCVCILICVFSCLTVWFSFKTELAECQKSLISSQLAGGRWIPCPENKKNTRLFSAIKWKRDSLCSGRLILFSCSLMLVFLSVFYTCVFQGRTCFSDNWIQQTRGLYWWAENFVCVYAVTRKRDFIRIWLCESGQVDNSAPTSTCERRQWQKRLRQLNCSSFFFFVLFLFLLHLYIYLFFCVVCEEAGRVGWGQQRLGVFLLVSATRTRRE